MKQKLLCSIIICTVLMGNVCIGQVTQSPTPGQSGPTYYNNFTTPFASTIIPLSGLPLNSYGSAASGSRIGWLEYGDGGFSSNGYSTRSLAQVSGGLKNWLFVSSKLYDNTRDQLRIQTGGPFSQPTSPRTNNPSDNDVPILTTPNNSPVPNRILITPNAYDIINKDTMCFAVTYKFQPADGKCYYIVFNYNYNSNNTNPAFSPMASGGNPTNLNLGMLIQNTRVKYARTFHLETNANPNTIPNFQNFLSQQINGSYANYVLMKLPICNSTEAFAERNMFFSLVTNDLMANGNTTSINAAILETNSSDNSITAIVDQYTISGMQVSSSHDPNYIAQTPVCLQLPKIPRLFNYHLHFQNVGAGNADQVKITLQFTPGFDFNTFNITRARFSDDNYNINNAITIQKFPSLNQVVLTMDLHGDNIRNLNNPLAGTNSLANPWTSLETMGDIYFNMQATAAVPYFITSQAFIEFHSAQTIPPQWEASVATNTAVSTYSNCCNCAIFNCGNSKDSTNRIKKAIPIRKNK